MERRYGMFEDLLNIEVNTIVKPSMTAEKMPPLPFALLDIIEEYGTKLQVELGIDLAPYLRPSAEACWRRIEEQEQRKHQEKDYGSQGEDKYDRHRNYLEEAQRTRARVPGQGPPRGERDFAEQPTFDCLADLWPAFKTSYLAADHVDEGCEAPPVGAFGEVGASFLMDKVNNGWDTFERLRIATSMAPKDKIKDHEVTVARIISSCSRIKYLIQGLQQNPPNSKPRRRARGDAAVAELHELIPKTRNQLLHGEVRHKNVPHLLRSEELGQVRKIWEVGTERVLMQTCVQIDGDVVTRISEQLFEPDMVPLREMIIDAHRRSVDVGLAHWRSLVEVAIELFSKVLGKLTR
jgi:hypothetical protein